jgi:5-methylcytosine-specific restriction enzyme subunit McrC
VGMSKTPATLIIREWSRSTPEDAPLLRGLTLTGADRELLSDLQQRTSLRVEELRQGLLIEIGPHIGTLTLSGLHLVILPKLRLDTLMAMVAYAFNLSDLVWTDKPGAYVPAEHGFVDLLGLSLLKAVERIARGGLLSCYQNRQEELTSPRGRIDMQAAASRPRRPVLRCDFHELTTDHRLNQVLAAGLRLAAQVVQSAGLRMDLLQAAERWFVDQQRLPLTAATLQSAHHALDRRSRYYRTALSLVTLFFQGGRPGSHAPAGELSLAGFLLDMNRVFEHFLTRYLQEHTPPGLEVISQEVRTDVFAYLENPAGWRRPTIRPDLVFRYHGQTVAVGDAKYRNHQEQPPGTTELYQLITYGLAYDMPTPREVLLFYPLGSGETERPVKLLFAPGSATEKVQLRLVGVPIDDMLSGQPWWPMLARLGR